MATVTFTPEAWEQASGLPKSLWQNWEGEAPAELRTPGKRARQELRPPESFRVEGDNVVIVKVGQRDRFYED